MSGHVNDNQIPWWDIRNKVATKRKTKVVNSNSWSSYWMDDDSYDYFYDDTKEKSKIKIDGMGGNTVTIDLAKASRLSAVRRAVGNFVRILTNDDEVTVVFSSGNDSYTDGKTVVISAESDPKKFDVLVGTALHESAHCVFSQELLEMLRMGQIKDMVCDRFDLIYETVDEHLETVNQIVNVLDDRRIDTEVYGRAPGYRPYYQSMYDHHWNARDIAKAILRTEKLKVPTVDAYMFRIINLTNPAIKYVMDKYLPEFRKIYDMIDLNNILRFSNPDGTVRAKELVECAMDIYQIILDNKIDEEAVESPNIDGQSSGDEQQDKSDQNMSGAVGMGSNDNSGTIGDSGGGDPDLGNHDLSSQSGQSQMSDEDIEKAVAEALGKRNLGKSNPKMDKLEEKMMDFLNGNIKKKKITKKMQKAVKTMEEGGVNVSSVEIEGESYPYVRVPRLTASSEHILPTREMFGGWTNHNLEYIKQGRRLGQIMVDRIKIRHDNNETKFSRRPVGKIDKRLIHSLGTDNHNVFFTKVIQDYKDSVIYLTVDCSSSMYGEKWKQSVILTTGLAYAASKINNFDIVVNLRYGLASIWSINMFDSRKEPFSHFEKWIAKFSPNNTTPESIVYEIEKDFIESIKTNDNNVYFVTMTDGGANYTPAGQRRGYYNHGFGSETAQKHCRQMLKRFREIGIVCMSYFIGRSHNFSGSYHDWEKNSFKSAYGKDGVFVPLDNFSMISKSFNDLLTRSVER